MQVKPANHTIPKKKTRVSSINEELNSDDRKIRNKLYFVELVSFTRISTVLGKILIRYIDEQREQTSDEAREDCNFLDYSN